MITLTTYRNLLIGLKYAYLSPRVLDEIVHTLRHPREMRTDELLFGWLPLSFDVARRKVRAPFFALNYQTAIEFLLFFVVLLLFRSTARAVGVEWIRCFLWCWRWTTSAKIRCAKHTSSSATL